MPRNRKKRPPAERVEATIDLAGAHRLETIRCGACRQRLPLFFLTFFGGVAEIQLAAVTHGEDVPRDVERLTSAMIEAVAIRAWGWRFDDGIWRPTADARARWLRACEVQRQPHRFTSAELEAARVCLAWGGASRKDKDRLRGKDRREYRLTPEDAERFTLPTRIECIQCGALNRVAAPVASAPRCEVESLQ